MTVNRRCKYCGTEMKEVRKEEVAGSVYHYMRCEHCRKEVARRDD